MAAPVATGPPTAFTLLPIEINKNIATYIHSDKDLGSYRLICRSTHDAVDADGCAFWRIRFHDVFETLSFKLSGQRLVDNEMFRDQYQRRTGLLRKGFKSGKVFDIKAGATKLQKACLRVLRDLIIDCFTDKKDGDGAAYKSRNLDFIIRFVEGSNLLKHIAQDPNKNKRCGRSSTSTAIPDPLLVTMQCLMAPLLFSFSSNSVNDHFGFAEAQQIAYGHDISHPIFHGCNGVDVNMPWVLANIQFWRHHMLRKNEGILDRGFQQLKPDERPQWFSSQLSQNTCSVGSDWKGCYAFTDRNMIDRVRAGFGLNNDVIDEMNGESSGDFFQNLGLAVTEPGSAPWPRIFEKHLKSITPPPSRAKTRAQKSAGSPNSVQDILPQSFRFDGEGRDVDEDFSASGWLNPLPLQNGVPGWQRMTMMKYFFDDDGRLDEEALWAYEGVLMPGGKLILGRWWCPSDGVGEDMYSGPFILWCTDKETEATDEDGVSMAGLEEAAEDIQYE